MTLGPGFGGRGLERVRSNRARQPGVWLRKRSGPRTVPATGCAAAFSARTRDASASAAAFFAESVGGGGAPNSFRNTVNGLLSRLNVNDAEIDVRYGLSSAVSLSVLPRNKEYWLEKSKPGRRSERSEYPHVSVVKP